MRGVEQIFYNANCFVGSMGGTGKIFYNAKYFYNANSFYNAKRYYNANYFGGSMGGRKN